MKIKIRVEKTTTGYNAYAEKYSAYTTGNDVVELRNNMVESLNLLFEAEGKDKVVSVSDLTFDMNLSSIFEVYPVNMKALSKRIGMNYNLLNQYVRGTKKPSSKQAMLIIDELHQIGRELTGINLIQ
jgi:hypothetical protein